MHILLAVDGSPSSIQARDLVAGLSWPDATAITVVTAYQFASGWLGGTEAVGERLADAEEDFERAAQAKLAELSQPLDGRGWKLDPRFVRGRPGAAIVAVAEECSADLVVLGSRGHGPIGSMMLGSVSAEVAEHAPCAVLVARGPTVSRLLVATDGSECSSIIPDVLGDLAVFAGMPAVALSVTPVDSPAFEIMVKLYTLGGYDLEPEQDVLRERHRRFAATMAEQLEAVGLPTRAEVHDGDAAQEIISAATATNSDLVVTGSHGLHGIDRWLLGSVARNVLLHAKSSVMVVRRRASPGRP